MTKKQKIIIISIVVLLLSFYIVTLVMFSSQDDSEPNAGSGDATPDWTKTMNSLMSVFAERVDLTNLSCNSQPVSSEFTLSSSNSCKIIFNSSSLPGEEDFWKTEVEVLTTNTGVYTKYSDAECGKSGNSGVTSLPASSIELGYLEEGKSVGTPYCWLKQEDSAVSFTILNKNDGLTITCNQCSVPVKMKMN